MEEKSTATLEKIQRAAMEEFSEKGFLGASLRQIVKQAGVTTGAFYGYFSSKEPLFASIVEPHAAALMGRFMEAQTSFAELPEQEQPLLRAAGMGQRIAVGRKEPARFALHRYRLPALSCWMAASPACGRPGPSGTGWSFPSQPGRRFRHGSKACWKYARRNTPRSAGFLF